MKLGAWVVMLFLFCAFVNIVGLGISGLDTVVGNSGLTLGDDGQVQSVDLEQSSIWKKLFVKGEIDLFGVSVSGGVLVGLIGGALVTVGLFARGYDPSLVILPFVVFIGTVYISTFWHVISYVITLHQSWLTWIIALIFGGLGIGFTFALVDYFANR